MSNSVCFIYINPPDDVFGCCLSVCREDVSNNLTLAVAPDVLDESKLNANDFLIRGIIGMDPKGGAIAVGDAVGVGKRIRFMVGVQHPSKICAPPCLRADSAPTLLPILAECA